MVMRRPPQFHRKTRRSVLQSIRNYFCRSESKEGSWSTYSQCGEDAIVDFLLKSIGVGPLKYLDLGANDPIKFNNTYKFYKLGCSGVLVEADVDLAEKIRRVRPRDICVAKAVGVTSSEEIEFFKMTADTLSTTKRTTADRYELESEHRLAVKRIVPAIHINKLLEIYYPDDSPNFVSLDVEGLDLDLLHAWDFARWRPAVFCVETLTYTQTNKADKIDEIFTQMSNVGYLLYADTYINSIFVEKSAFGSNV